MNISNIKAQVKNTERVSVFVDGKYSFSLNLSELLTERLKVGDEIDELRLKALKKLSDEGKIKGRAHEWLLIRPHSVKEFNDYLRRKKIDPDFAHSLINEFSEKGYVDDVRFARWFLDQRARKLKSKRFITAELRQKGVEPAIIDEVLIDYETNDVEQIKELIIKKRLLNRYDDEQKLITYLMRQGFSYGDIKKAITSDS